jgi:light-regulated signal transduction histidine kinase (bacteriophytochrome)
MADGAAQLEAANQELESLTYAVSHDLRAPLRSIRGFSQVLLERHAAQLDGEGLEFLERICASCEQMDALLEALLLLSRANRSAMRRLPVDLSVLAEAIAADLRRREPDRAADWRIAPGLRAEGDESLLRETLGHLLGNAWKFTRSQPRAVIQFGREAGPRAAFFVRDNGAGFDMARAGKLFGVFQRLHPAGAFPGVGVGLAIVRRVITRHGGLVWAAAAPGQGATFFFTLPCSTGAADETPANAHR